MLHRTDTVQAGAVTPADHFTSRPDRPGALHRVEKTQVARSHEKRAVPIEPKLVTWLQVGAQRERTGARDHCVSERNLDEGCQLALHVPDISDALLDTVLRHVLLAFQGRLPMPLP